MAASNWPHPYPHSFEEIQIFLGRMYLFGQGVERDFVSAYMWTTLGASAPGVSTGTLDVLTRFMTPEQIAEAEARARDWGE